VQSIKELFLDKAPIHTESTTKKNTLKMSTFKVVHELTSATLRPFVESNSVVLLAVLMLPQSGQCQAFVPVFHSVSDKITLYLSSDHGL
jgi:hypothetical protein